MSSLCAFIVLSVSSVTWQHPAGMLDDAKIVELQEKIDTLPWAENMYASRERNLQPWVNLTTEELHEIFPRRGGNVYHNLSCPDDRVRLSFNQLNPDHLKCPVCKKTFPQETDAGIYKTDHPYHGTVYDGWICLFHLTTSAHLQDMALIGRMESDRALQNRAIEILMLYAEVLPTLPLRHSPNVSPTAPTYKQYNRILTYHREGDNKILHHLAQAYELLRDRMSDEQQAIFEKDVLIRLLDDIMIEPFYVYDHNNIYQWHRTIVQVGLALEREDLIDWAFGFGKYNAESLPEHRSMNRILETHFNEDGAFWELCSGYHLYPLTHLCEFSVLSHNLSKMDPIRFPADRYDLTRKESKGGQVIHNALEWFMSMAMPDRTMTVIGDSTKARAGMETYTMTAEVGYRYFDIKAVGDYEKFRNGKRSWEGFLYGANFIEQHETPYTSSNLSSGWVSLRSEWNNNRTWVGLNSLIRGGSHQHADRLGMTLYSQGELLALEKSVPYNESTLRSLGTYSQMHNTVTIDMQSQNQGERLKDEELPTVQFFHTSPVVQFAELHGDNIYPKTKKYRRSVALVGDITVDLFRVEGGKVHDWMVHHGGMRPTLSISTQELNFEPKEWLKNGSNSAQGVTTSDRWTAQWSVGEVTSQLMMLEAPDTEVFSLETYPLNNAVVTENHPTTQSLCVRRHDDEPFLAIWNAWLDKPNLNSVKVAKNRKDALILETTSHRYYIAFGPGTTEHADGTVVNTDAAFSIVRDHDGVSLIDVSHFSIKGEQGQFNFRHDSPISISVLGEHISITPSIAYETRGGTNYPATATSELLNSIHWTSAQGNWFTIKN